MTKDEFLKQLRSNLVEIPEMEWKDILYDYEEHFQIGTEIGKTEDEISSSLGSPHSIAKELLAEYRIRQAEISMTLGNIFSAIISSVTLGLLNFLFVLIPFLICIALIIGLYALVLGLLTAPFIVLYNMIVSKDLFEMVRGLFLIATCFGFGVLLWLGMTRVTKWFFSFIVRYLQYNLRIIRRRSEWQ